MGDNDSYDHVNRVLSFDELSSRYRGVRFSTVDGVTSACLEPAVCMGVSWNDLDVRYKLIHEAVSDYAAVQSCVDTCVRKEVGDMLLTIMRLAMEPLLSKAEAEAEAEAEAKPKLEPKPMPKPEPLSMKDENKQRLKAFILEHLMYDADSTISTTEISEVFLRHTGVVLPEESMSAQLDIWLDSNAALLYASDDKLLIENVMKKRAVDNRRVFLWCNLGWIDGPIADVVREVRGK